MFTNVIVLTPNGRRQNIKTTPNTTILQILEEACTKQGYKSEEYDLKHHRNVLDTSIPLRFSSLPNNATLEMIPASKIRADGELVLGVHLEDGKRVTGNFKPQDTLLDILNTLCPNDVKYDENPVLIYMRREIYGSALKETSLRDLGLTSGRAMFRLIHRSPDALKNQANVSAPLPTKPAEDKPYVRKLQKIEEPQKPIAKIETQQPKSGTTQFKSETAQFKSETTTQSKSETTHQSNEETEKKSLIYTTKPENKSNALLKTIKQEKRKQTDKLPIKNSKKHAINEGGNSEVEDFVFLGARNAILFSYEMAKAIPSEDLLDDFFELTIDDAKKLLTDLKKQRCQFENGKLKTAAMRELEESKKQLRLLNQYKKAIIRIQFPNHTVLQGTFLPVETIDHVLQFVREYLEDKNINFYLYTTPPKEVLDPISKLIDIGCVPGALIHFGTNATKDNNEFLRKDLSNKLTSVSKASLLASKTREANSRQVTFNNDDDDEDDVMMPANDVNIGASTSSGITYENYDNKKPVVQEKVPKWFKNP